jgi:SAM-dependent methyltransferase
MPYGEKLSQLNPCSPQKTGRILSARIRDRSRVIDIGCGRGATLDWLAKNTKYELHGTDADSSYALEAQKVCPMAKVIHADAEALPYADGAFDAAIVECVFSLSCDPTVIAGEISRIIRSDGVLLLSDLFLTTDAYVDGFAYQTCKNALTNNMYTKQVIEGFFIGSGFAVIEFMDCTDDLRSMFAHMIMDGSADVYLDADTRKNLRQMKAGYGIWVFKKD